MLVDGGLTRNLPVDVARAMGADVIIAVNLGTPLLPREQITSALSVALQMLNILTEQNVGTSLASLKPGDVLIQPELGPYSAGDFDNMPSTIPIGEAAARKVAEQLKQYSLPPAQYAAHRQTQVRNVAQDTRRVDQIRVEGLERVNEQVVIQSMVTSVGEPLDVATLDLDMRRIYGRGDFEHVGYALIDEPDHRILAVQAVEKAWGPTYVRFGLSLSSDFRGDNAFNLLAQHPTYLAQQPGRRMARRRATGQRRPAVHRVLPAAGGQPVLLHRAARAGGCAGRPTSMAARMATTWRRATTSPSPPSGLDLGSQFTKYGELRVGVMAGQGEADLQIGDPILAQYSIKRDVGAVRTRLYLDQLDSTSLPAHRLQPRWADLRVDHQAGRDRQLQPLEPQRARRQVLRAAHLPGGPGRRRLDRRQPAAAVRLFGFGGFLRMTGYREGQLRNDSMTYGRLTYMNQLFKMPLLEGVYVGASLEAARLGSPLIPTGIQGNVASASLFFAVDTPLGPAYLAYGHTQDGNSNVYFYLGKR